MTNTPASVLLDSKVPSVSLAFPPVMTIPVNMAAPAQLYRVEVWATSVLVWKATLVSTVRLKSMTAPQTLVIIVSVDT